MLSASRRDGVSGDLERAQLRYGAELISECGILLRFPRVLIASAQVLFHKFYMVASLRTHCHIWMVAASLLVASKAEEVHRRIRDIATVVHHQFCSRENLGQRDDARNLQPLEYYGQPGYEWKMAIVSAERHLLRELGFQVFVEHAHKYVLVFVNTLREKSGAGEWREASCTLWQTLLQRCWNYAGDIHCSQVVAVASPESLACACITIGAEDCGFSLPEGWDTLFGGEASVTDFVRKELWKICALPLGVTRFVDVALSNIAEDCASRSLSAGRSAVSEMIGTKE